MQRTIKLLDQLIVKYETNLGLPHRKSPLEAGSTALDLCLFTHLDIRVGNLTEIWKHPASTKLWCERIDLGEGTSREVATGLQQHRTEEEMKGLVLVVANLPAKTVAGFSSNGMILCVTKGEDIYPLRPPAGSVVGERVGLGKGLGQSEFLPQLEGDFWEKALPHLHTDSQGQACFGDQVFTTSAGAVTSSLQDALLS